MLGVCVYSQSNQWPTPQLHLPSVATGSTCSMKLLVRNKSYMTLFPKPPQTHLHKQQEKYWL